MFDIGFTEMMLIAVVALLVIGPKDLPKVARRVGEWMGKLRRYVEDVKSDINRQVELEELKDIKNQVTEAAQTIQSGLQSTVAEAQSGFTSLTKTATDFGDGSGAPPETPTDWDKVYATRRLRQKYKERRIERERELGIKRKPIARKS